MSTHPQLWYLSYLLIPIYLQLRYEVTPTATLRKKMLMIYEYGGYYIIELSETHYFLSCCSSLVTQLPVCGCHNFYKS